MPNLSSDRPLDMLAACHRGIERELVALEGLEAHLTRHGCDEHARSVADGVLRYFNTTGEVHHQDEDDDLFPLLRRRAAVQGRADIAAAIEELEREHETMHAQWRRLRKRLEHIAAGEGGLDGDDVTKFAWLYRRHMEREAAAVTPFARITLDGAEMAALGERMTARRTAA